MVPFRWSLSRRSVIASAGQHDDTTNRRKGNAQIFAETTRMEFRQRPSLLPYLPGVNEYRFIALFPSPAKQTSLVVRVFVVRLRICKMRMHIAQTCALPHRAARLPHGVHERLRIICLLSCTLSQVWSGVISKGEFDTRNHCETRDTKAAI